MDLKKFTREELLLGSAGVLLAIDLLFLPWYDINLTGLGLLVVSVTSTGTGSPDGWLGVLGVLAALALVADLALERAAGRAVFPALDGSRATTRLALALVAGVCVGSKFLLHAHLAWLGGGFWGAAVLAVALVVLATRIRDAERAAATHPGATHPATHPPAADLGATDRH